MSAIRTGGLLFLGRVGGAFFGVISSILWVRLLSPEAFGHYQTALSVLLIAGTLSLSGMNEAATISSSKGYDRNFRLLIVRKLLAGVIGAAGIIGWGTLLQDETLASMLPMLIPLALLFPITDLTNLRSPWLAGKGQYWLLMLGNLVESAIVPSVLVTLWLVKAKDPVTIVTVIHSLFAVYASLTTFGLLRSLNPRGESNLSPIRYGYHATLAAIPGALLFSDKLFIGHYLTPQDVAVYSVALIFPNQIKVIFGVINESVSRGLAAASTVADSWRYLRGQLLGIWAIFAGLGLVGAILIPYLIQILFPREYAGAISYCQFLWVVLNFTAPATFLGIVLSSQQKLGFIYLARGASPFLTFLAYWLLAPRYGIWGVVVGRGAVSVLTALVYTGFLAYYLRRETLGRVREG